MQRVMQPIIHMARVNGLAVHVQKARLCLNDPATLRPLPDGRIGVYAEMRRPWLGMIPRRRIVHMGELGPEATRIVTPYLLAGSPLRIRIVALTPEHLARGAGPEVQISVWGEIDEAIPALSGVAPVIPAVSGSEGGPA